MIVPKKVKESVRKEVSNFIGERAPKLARLPLCCREGNHDVSQTDDPVGIFRRGAERTGRTKRVERECENIRGMIFSEGFLVQSSHGWIGDERKVNVRLLRKVEETIGTPRETMDASLGNRLVRFIRHRHFHTLKKQGSEKPSRFPPPLLPAFAEGHGLAHG